MKAHSKSRKYNTNIDYAYNRKQEKMPAFSKIIQRMNRRKKERKVDKNKERN